MEGKRQLVQILERKEQLDTEGESGMTPRLWMFQRSPYSIMDRTGPEKGFSAPDGVFIRY
jgi:hypothetical protein